MSWLLRAGVAARGACASGRSARRWKGRVGYSSVPEAAKPLTETGSTAGGGPSEGSSSSNPYLTWKRLLGTAAMASFIGGGAYVSTRNPGTISSWAFAVADQMAPLLRVLDPEDAHSIAITMAANSLLPRERRKDDPSLALQVWGRQFQNPLGLAAGFDKNAEAVEQLLGLGFGFVEVGSVTPIPQEGNPRPRVFRLPEAKAVINRYGFNSEGIVAVAKRLGVQHGRRKTAERPEGLRNSKEQPGGKGGKGLVGVNLGKNKYSEDAIGDYLQGVHSLSQYADYLVIAARDEMQWPDYGPPPLLVKIAPDLEKQDLADIAAVALALRLDGLIIANTTTKRPDEVLGLVHADQQGGLSGRPLFSLSTHVLSEMYKLTKGKIPLVGCGGVFSGEDAYAKIRAGATLVQIWTSLAYEGPGVVPKIKKELADLLRRDGYASVAEAIGADHRPTNQPTNQQ